MGDSLLPSPPHDDTMLASKNNNERVRLLIYIECKNPSYLASRECHLTMIRCWLHCTQLSHSHHASSSQGFKNNLTMIRCWLFSLPTFHNIKYAYKLLLNVSMHFVLPHDRVKPVYKSQTIGAYHGGRPRRDIQSISRLST